MLAQQEAQLEKQQPRLDPPACLNPSLTCLQMLAQKEAQLEGQQQKLLAWAAELQRGEAQLTGATQQTQQAEPPASPAPASSSGVPQPIPSESPLLAGRSLSPMQQPAGTPPPRRGLDEAALAAAAADQQHGMRTPTAAAAAPGSGAAVGGGEEESSGGGGGGQGESTMPVTPAGPGEWTEEFEQVGYAVLSMLCCPC